MYPKNKIVGRAEHNVLVSSGLGQKAGEETSALWRSVHGPQARNVSMASGCGRIWVRSRQLGWWKRSDLFRADLAEWKPCAPLGRRSMGCPLAVAV